MGLFDVDNSASRLPVSVITGFLGSDKTTLLNKLLRHAGMGDSAVIINEFGEVPLDHLLVEAVEGEVGVLGSGRRAFGPGRSRRSAGVFADSGRDDRTCRSSANRSAVAEQSAGQSLRAP